jgi:chlorite dismutase
MSHEKELQRPPSGEDLPPVPLTLDGSLILHQMFRFRWASWTKLTPPERAQVVEEAVLWFEEIESREKRQSAIFS